MASSAVCYQAPQNRLSRQLSSVATVEQLIGDLRSDRPCLNVSFSAIAKLPDTAWKARVRLAAPPGKVND
jgi:hypothetical protein